MMSKARQTISNYTELIPVFVDGVKQMAVDVASCSFGDAKYLYDTEKTDLLEYSATKTNIERFADIFEISKSRKIKVDYDIFLKRKLVEGSIESFTSPGTVYQIRFPFYNEREILINSAPVENFFCYNQRNHPVTGANMVVDKHIKFFGNLMSDLFGIRNYGIFGAKSEGFNEIGKVVEYVGRNREKYEKIPASQRSNKLLNERFLLKRISLQRCVNNYINK